MRMLSPDANLIPEILDSFTQNTVIYAVVCGMDAKYPHDEALRAYGRKVWDFYVGARKRAPLVPAGLSGQQADELVAGIQAHLDAQLDRLREELAAVDAAALH